MNMSPRTRKFALYAHLTFSIGWLGAVLPYLALAVAGLVSPNPQTVRSVYPAMELIGWWVIVPFSIAALLSGLVQALGTPWGLLRHWWIVVKFVLTAVATLILLRHMQEVSRVAALTAQAALGAEFRQGQIQLLIHPAGGLLVLLGIMVISYVKPWGRTPYREQKSEVAPVPSRPRAMASEAQPPTKHQPPFWLRVVKIHLIHAAALGLLFVAVLHLSGGGMHHH